MRRIALVPALLALASLGIFPAPSPARQAAAPGTAPDRPALAVETIMAGEEFVGSSPETPRWSVDGRTVYFRWKAPGAKEAATFAATLADPRPRPVKPEELLRRPAVAENAAGGRFRFGGSGAGVTLDAAGRRGLVEQEGDLFLVDLARGGSRRLTQTDARESGARFAGGSDAVVFSSGDNLFRLDLRGGTIVQLTAFTRQAPPEGSDPGAIEKWYADQQKALFGDLGGRRGFGSDRGGDLPRLAQGQRRKPFVLEEGDNVRSELSPDGRTVSFTLYGNASAKSTVVPAYVTRSGYTETLPSHPKAAEGGYGGGRMGLMSVETGEIRWIDAGQGDRTLSLRGLLWSPDGRAAVVSAYSDDRKDAWLLRLDPATGKTTLLQAVHDPAWIGEFGLTGVFWWPDGSAVSFISEKDGYAHLYKIAAAGGRPAEPLTSGRFEVSRASLSKDGRRIFLQSNEAHPGELHGYVMPAAGGARTRLTSLGGRNETVLSPDESVLAILHSESNRPPELYLQAARPGAPAAQVTDSTTPAFKAYPWADPEIVSFPARDGASVYARLFTPPAPDPRRPAVVFIHGAGYLQNAHRGWSTYFREYMFHNLLVERGYTVLDVDYRGSAGYGRDFRTGIYRRMGGKDLDDLVDAAKYLADRCGVDPKRIGCYGGSYGGFLTLMAMFTAPDAFRAGAALRPVTDWAHYHAGYTRDILNLPQDDPDAFKASSPIWFAAGLRGALLICHGMVDTNVHFQDSVRLAQRLIDLGKESWEIAPYPLEDHSFTRATSWTDEYRRILKLFERELKS